MTDSINPIERVYARAEHLGLISDKPQQVYDAAVKRFKRNSLIYGLTCPPVCWLIALGIGSAVYFALQRGLKYTSRGAAGVASIIAACPAILGGCGLFGSIARDAKTDLTLGPLRRRSESFDGCLTEPIGTKDSSHTLVDQIKAELEAVRKSLPADSAQAKVIYWNMKQAATDYISEPSHSEALLRFVCLDHLVQGTDDIQVVEGVNIISWGDELSAVPAYALQTWAPRPI